MIYWHIFLAFFIPNILGYGGGPASVPLIEKEVVGRYGWMTTSQFGEAFAIGNALPGPIATKMAGYIGYEVAGIPGALVALFATVAPSLLLMIFLLGILYTFKDSPKVKRMTNYVRPVIAVLLGVLTYQFFAQSILEAGIGHSIFLILGSYYLLEKRKVHPALVIGAGLLYGALFLA